MHVITQDWTLRLPFTRWSVNIVVTRWWTSEEMRAFMTKPVDPNRDYDDA